MLTFLVLLGERPLAAYTDPGTGTLLWQVLAAGLVGVSFYFRKIVSIFKGRRRNEEETRKRHP